MIQWQRQPTRRSCGQTCVAMLLGKPAVEVLVAFKRKRSTRTRDLVEHLRALGWTTSLRLKTLRSVSALPAMAIVKFSFPAPAGSGRKFRSGWHWVVWADGRFFDPDNPQFTMPGGSDRAVPTGFIEVQAPVAQ